MGLKVFFQDKKLYLSKKLGVMIDEKAIVIQKTSLKSKKYRHK